MNYRDFLNFLQGASNAAAGTVSGPVDLINAGLGLVGMGTKEPMGGSKWMERKGLTAPAPGKAGLLGEAAGMSAPIVAAAKAPQIAKGLLKMADNAAQPGLLGSERGAIVWHGSPHKFDKFDSSKIGTGEGAQAYGHGLYLAESDRVAKQYADTLTDKAPRFLDGVPADQLSTAQRSALGMLADAGGNPNAALLAAKTDMARSGGAGAEFHVERYNTLRDIARGKLQAQVGEPSLYKVDLPDDAIARMLDWDKPLSQQAPGVREAIERLGITSATDGGDLYWKLKRTKYGTKESMPAHPLAQEAQGYAAELMRQQGIPGIRYLDGGSRSGGAGTSNFVVFPGEEEMLKILERNGAPLR